MAIIATTAGSVEVVHTSDPDVSVELPEDVDFPQWITVARVSSLGGTIAHGATVVSVGPLNGADYYRCQALMPPLENPSSEERAQYGSALEAIAAAGVSDVQGFEGGVSAMVKTLRADHLDALAGVILRISRGRSV